MVIGGCPSLCGTAVVGTVDVMGYDSLRAGLGGWSGGDGAGRGAGAGQTSEA